MNSSEIAEGLSRLGVVASVLYVAAHPDDENNFLLSYLSKERKLRTGYLSLTRGEGGQNLIGKESGHVLGLIRTQELLAARKIDGAEQFFTKATDFGFSKNIEDTFTIWNKDSLLSDVVQIMEYFKPDVVINRFPNTKEAGHGHHTASAILALEAFDVMAEPKPKRIFWNTYVFGIYNTTAPDQLQIEIGMFNNLLGKSYPEMGTESTSMHKTQGFGAKKKLGSKIEYFKVLKGENASKDLFEGIDITWGRFKETVKFKTITADLLKKFDFKQPHALVPDLLNFYQELRNLDTKNEHVNAWKFIKLKETEALIFACLGLQMHAYSETYSASPRDEIDLIAEIVQYNKGIVKLNRISFVHQTVEIDKVLKNNELNIFTQAEKLPEKMAWSNPHWLNQFDSNREDTFSKELFFKAENDAPLKILFDLDIENSKGSAINFKIEKNVSYRFTHPVKGEQYRPFEILPPANVNINEQIFVFNELKPKNLTFHIQANRDNVSGTIIIDAPMAWKIELKNPHFHLLKKGDEYSINLSILPEKNSKNGDLKINLQIEDQIFSASIQRVNYDHIPSQFILSAAKMKLVYVPLKTEAKKIGYIPGAGDDIPNYLTQIGYEVTILSDELLMTEDLSKFSAILTGLRAYNVNKKLYNYHAKLMDYVKNGGNLISQYNTNSYMNMKMDEIGPYPFTISRDRVTNQNSKVEFIKPESPILHFPNLITAQDFEGWQQERGLYFATQWHENYQTVFAMADAGEEMNQGGLIYTKHGKGNFIYTGLSFFRQLPFGVVGAYRLLVNLISLPAHKK